jgi:serine/threonine-protein kinase
VKGSIFHRDDSTPPVVDLASAVSLGLPPDLAAQAGSRLGAMALAYAGGYAVLYTLSRLFEDFPGGWGFGGLAGPDVTAVVFIGTSLFIFAIAVSGRVDPYRLLHIGLFYEVFGALGVEIDILWWPALGLWPPDEAFAVNGISWTCPWIVLFPLIVPSTPGKATLAAFCAASIRPLLLLIVTAQGGAFAGADFSVAAITDLVLPNYVCFALAVVGARIVWGYGSHISKARRMGRYRLVELIGEGGMGEVWMAEHQMLARPAAVKLIRSDPAQESTPGGTPDLALHRFEREVQAMAELRSPHTVVVYDYGYTQDRTFYYVMELLEGLSLQTCIEKYGPMPAERVIHILRQVCHSLAEAHERGMVHRDIKPANIFICRYGRESDFVKVLDFGLVKRLGRQSAHERDLTDIGSFAGTPAYAPPEGVLADRKAVDARSDLYSLGCVAFWMLTGHTVFDARTPLAMLVKQAKETPDPPSRHSEFVVPQELDTLILECLAKDRTARPSSAEQMEERLAAIRCEGAWTRQRARDWWDLHVPSVTVFTPPAEGAC